MRHRSWPLRSTVIGTIKRMGDHRGYVTGEPKRRRGSRLKSTVFVEGDELRIAWRVGAVFVAATLCLVPSIMYAPVGFQRFVVGALSVTIGSAAVGFVCGFWPAAYGDMGRRSRHPYPADVCLRIAMASAPFVFVVCLVGFNWATNDWPEFDETGAFAIAGVFATPFALSALWGVLERPFVDRSAGSAAS